MPSRPIAVTGRGTIGCSGSDVSSTWNNALSGKSQIKNGRGSVSQSLILSALKNSGPLKNHLARCAEDLGQYRFEFLTLAALDQAMQEAGWTSLKSTDGIILGTTTGQLLTWEKVLGNFPEKTSAADLSLALKNEPLSWGLDRVLEWIGFTGPRCVITTACSGSTHAIGIAKLWLNEGKVTRCLAGGTETQSWLTQAGFGSFQLTSFLPCTPFDKQRTGINLSEGSAMLCLETKSSRPLAFLSGTGASNDAFHMTSPHPEGRGSFVSMRQALSEAGIEPSQVSWVHAHGTGSLANDLAEGKALENLFARHPVPVSSTKAIHGHALAASGAMESVLVIEALQQQTMLPSSGLQTPDPKLNLNFVRTPMIQPLSHVLKNTLGFGGSNASLVWSRA